MSGRPNKKGQAACFATSVGGVAQDFASNFAFDRIFFVFAGDGKPKRKLLGIYCSLYVKSNTRYVFRG